VRRFSLLMTTAHCPHCHGEEIIILLPTTVMNDHVHRVHLITLKKMGEMRPPLAGT